MGLGFNMLGQRGREPRLADTRLAGDQHHPPFAALRLLPAAGQQLEFLITPDERRRPGAQRLEAAQDAALTDDAPSMLRFGKPGERLRAEIGEIE